MRLSVYSRIVACVVVWVPLLSFGQSFAPPVLYPTGGSAPVVSTLNYVAAQTIANAAIVPAGTGSAVTAVAGVSGTDLIIDINGYYIGGGFGAPLNPGEFVGFAGSFGSGGVLYAGNTSAAATATTCSIRAGSASTQIGSVGSDTENSCLRASIKGRAVSAARLTTTRSSTCSFVSVPAMVLAVAHLTTLKCRSVCFLIEKSPIIGV